MEKPTVRPVPECPEEAELAALVRGAVPPAGREELESHLSQCIVCRQTICEFLDQEQAAPALRTARLRPGFRRGAAAAASLLLLAAGAAVYRGGGDRAHPSAVGNFPPGTRAWDLAAPLATASGETLRVALPEGTLLTLGPRTRLRADAPREGDRWRLRLEEGKVEANVAPGKGASRISSPAGEILILGTRFMAKAFRLRRFPAGQDVLSVRLDEGKVQLATPAGAALLRPGARGLAFAGEPPVQQEGGMDRERALLDLLGTLLPAADRERAEGSWILPGLEKGARDRAATLWASGPSGGGTWNDALRETADPRLREAIAALIGICGAQGDR